MIIECLCIEYITLVSGLGVRERKKSFTLQTTFYNRFLLLLYELIHFFNSGINFDAFKVDNYF